MKIKVKVKPEKGVCNACLDRQVDDHIFITCKDCDSGSLTGVLVSIHTNIFGKSYCYVCMPDMSIRKVPLDRIVMDDPDVCTIFGKLVIPNDSDESIMNEPTEEDILEESLEEPTEEPMEETSEEPSTDDKCIADVIGTPAVLENLAEECVELAHAALKLARLIRDENPTPVTYNDILPKLNEEMGDIMICMNELVNAGVISYEAVDSSAMAKEQRWYERIEGKKAVKND